MIWVVSSSNSNYTVQMVANGLKELDEMVVLVELELLLHSVGILETMKSWNSLSIQDCQY